MELNLLDYLGIDSSSPRRRELDDTRRRRQFDEFQYQAHVAQEQHKRRMLEQNFTGRSCRYTNQERDQRHHYGNFWFAQGQTSDSSNVGITRAARPPIVHPLSTTDAPLAGATEDMAATAPLSSPRQSGATIVLRCKTPPPSSPPHTFRGTPPPTSYATPTATGHLDRDSAPYAEHYDNRALYNVSVPLPQFTLGGFQFDRNGVPRGANGVDNEEGRAREAQREIEYLRREQQLRTKREQQQLLRAQLDELVAIRRRKTTEERDLENRTIFGYSLPGFTGPEVQARHRQHRVELEQEWQSEAAAHSRMQAAEDEYYRPFEEDWSKHPPPSDAVTAVAGKLVLPGGKPATSDSRPAVGNQVWLQAWQEHQQREATLQRQQEDSRRATDELQVTPEILAYSQRILELERRKRAQQEEYRRDLDAQVARNKQNRRQTMAESQAQDSQYYHHSA